MSIDTFSDPKHIIICYKPSIPQKEGMPMKTGYELFIDQSGLTADEASEFLVTKMKQVMPNNDSEVDIEFVSKLAAEAKRWKKTKQKIK